MSYYTVINNCMDGWGQHSVFGHIREAPRVTCNIGGVLAVPPG